MSISQIITTSATALRHRRWANLCVVNLRILIGFAFLPAGLKKVLGQPFTDPNNAGAFHEFLDAFLATGFFYQFVGVVQLTIAVLLMTQSLATLGAMMAVPVTAAIAVFCWSTAGIPTSVVVTLMFLGAVGLCLWDYRKWLGVFAWEPADTRQSNEDRIESDPAPLPIEVPLWRAGGASILLVYLLLTALAGGVYRPKGIDLGNPAFYTLPVVALVPLVTWAIEVRRRKRSSGLELQAAPAQDNLNK